MAALTAALIGLTAASTAQGFLGARSAAKSARAQGTYEGSLADMNATLSDLQGTDALARGTQAANQSRVQTRQLVSGQKAAIAGSGVDVNSGSAADLQTEANYFGELDRLTITNNAKREAWGYGVQAANDRAQGQLARTAGKNAARANNAAAFSTLLTGASQMLPLGGQLRSEIQARRARRLTLPNSGPTPYPGLP